jgi:hypothetical protein
VHKAKIDIIRDDTALSQHHLGTSVELRLSKIAHFSRMKPFRQTPGRDFQIFCYFATKPVAAMTALVESTWSFLPAALEKMMEKHVPRSVAACPGLPLASTKVGIAM